MTNPNAVEQPGEASGAPSALLKVSEIFSSFQGEGASAGRPSVFLRLALCNLRCTWCDTKYTWDWSAHRYEDEVRRLSVDEVLAALARERENRLIVTGGEPLLQQAVLEGLLQRLPSNTFIEVETNGTIVPSPVMLGRVDQWNVSPKLENSGEPVARRIRREALAALQGSGRAWLKLVIGGEADLPEADALVASLGWRADRVLFMPQASRREELARRSPDVLAAALVRGHGFSPRLHIERFDGSRGV